MRKLPNPKLPRGERIRPHPLATTGFDVWLMGEPLLDRLQKVVFDQPQTFEARTDLARTFVDRMEVETDTLVDDIRNASMACYAAWPERIYVTDRKGRSSTTAESVRSISRGKSSARFWRT